jgi:uncharacterized damage-inducible protein DinB
MSANLDSYIKSWKRIHEQSKKVMAVTPDDKYDWKPCDSAMSLGELINHLWIAEAGLIQAAVDGVYPAESPAKISSTKDLLAMFDKSHEEAVAKVRALTPEQLSEEITPFGPAHKMSRMALLHLTHEHEIHHRGQLYTYLRIAGCEVPPLFG